MSFALKDIHLNRKFCCINRVHADCENTSFLLNVALNCTTFLVKLFARHILRMKEQQLENMRLKELVDDIDDVSFI